MEDHTLTLLFTAGGGLVVTVLTAFGTYRAGQAKQKAEIVASTEGRERKAYQEGFAAGCTSQAGQINALRADSVKNQQTIDALQEENMECREAFAKAVTAINFLDQSRRQTHDEMVAAGLRKGDFAPMPVSFAQPVADPINFRRHQADLNDQMAAHVVEQVRQDATKIRPPEPAP